MTADRRPPAERVRDRVAATVGPDVAAALPRGHQRLGRVLIVRLPESLRPAYAAIGEAWRAELGVATVLRHAGTTEGDWRTPRTEPIAAGPTETEVREHGIVYGLDAARVMFAAGNRTERRRAGAVTRPGETVVDLFAGIGYFTLPAAVRGRASRVWAVEANPVAYRYLVANAARNGVADRVIPILGDNREVGIPAAAADRIFLGFLPSAVGWVPRAVALARPGATIHVHLVVPSRDGVPAGEATVAAAVAAAGSEPARIEGRAVKPYGPGRTHVVVDATLPG
ncbi:MAG TPA: class I SAM-dependent methyltransferase family protein [Thermoplasmata archaeon]|nr:class I SAM-dependent methyltransferase family protein [Thermoplasmata archaeon]